MPCSGRETARGQRAKETPLLPYRVTTMVPLQWPRRQLRGKRQPGQGPITPPRSRMFRWCTNKAPAKLQPTCTLPNNSSYLRDCSRFANLTFVRTNSCFGTGSVSLILSGPLHFPRLPSPRACSCTRSDEGCRFSIFPCSGVQSLHSPVYNAGDA